MAAKTPSSLFLLIPSVLALAQCASPQPAPARDPAGLLGRFNRESADACLTALRAVVNKGGSKLPVAFNGDRDALSAAWRQLENRRYWLRWNDDASDFLRFVRMKDHEAWKSPIIHGVEMYGLENYRAWRRGADFLDNIPKGKFKPSIALFSELHRIGAGELQPLLKRLDPLIPDGFLPDKAGVLKRRWSIGRFSPGRSG